MYGIRFPSDQHGEDWTTWNVDAHDWEFEDAVPKPDPLVPGSERWSHLSTIHHQAKHMDSSDAIIFLNKYVKEETV